MSRWRGAWLLGGLVLASGGCRDGSPSAPVQAVEPLGEVKARVVYGTDYRRDVYAHGDATLRDRAMQSTVALMHASDLNVLNPGGVVFKTQTLGATYDLCTSERFWSDPVPAFCSGTLIDEALVLTAGHCIPTAEDCARTRFVFKFNRPNSSALAIVTAEDVFSCQDIVVRARGMVEGRQLDYAIVRLDRPATPRFTPAPLRPGNRPMGAGQPVAVIGTSSGTPLKIDSQVTVVEPRASALDYFVAATNTPHGSSGAGVYELNGQGLAGLLVRGDKAFSSASGNCRVARMCDETGCRGEEISYVRPAIEAYCQAESNPRLCPPGEALPPPNSYGFIAEHTDHAKQNTVNRKVMLSAGEPLFVGTCGLDLNAWFSGDTYLRVFGPAGTEVAFNDDACGGRGSRLFFSAQTAGEYEIRAGCHGEERCSGTVAWRMHSLNGTRTYSASSTTSATRNTFNWELILLEGQRLSLGTCGVTGASGFGDTFLRLHGPLGQLVAEDDDACGRLSYFVYVVPPGASGTYLVRAGCFSEGSCSGTVAWTIQ